MQGGKAWVLLDGGLDKAHGRVEMSPSGSEMGAPTPRVKSWGSWTCVDRVSSWASSPGDMLQESGSFPAISGAAWLEVADGCIKKAGEECTLLGVTGYPEPAHVWSKGEKLSSQKEIISAQNFSPSSGELFYMLNLLLIFLAAKPQKLELVCVLLFWMFGLFVHFHSCSVEMPASRQHLGISQNYCSSPGDKDPFPWINWSFGEWSLWHFTPLRSSSPGSISSFPTWNWQPTPPHPALSNPVVQWVTFHLHVLSREGAVIISTS